MKSPAPVIAVEEPVVYPTYPVGSPERNPVFFEKRVYQGSNGKVYPVPFIDKVGDTPEPVTYRSVRLENAFVRLVLLPEIGGRIHVGQHKSNGDYDFFYRQDVIKPALVGLAGPWISGGVEFNWPQHHRPGTFMPADFHVEEEADGARTVWMSEHDPIHRMKGMHGVRLRPNSSLIELRARLYNRTPLTRTFLWWANVAARVHERYQSFFPPDVHYVADHAVRALSSFPVARNAYYGVDYAAREGANDLTWYRNIPVPTSYMICQTAHDFFGGYDHEAGGGFVHVADRNFAPGKKQWTWGNHAFGHAWDRELTDAGGPYIELMAGVFTDNQPDFSYLLPYETKCFSQYWWPIRGIGPVQAANTRAALRAVVRGDRVIELGVNVSESVSGLRIRVRMGGAELLDEPIALGPGDAWTCARLRFEGESESALLVRLEDGNGNTVLEYQPVDRARLSRDRPQATEPEAPAAVMSADELFLIGEHLEQYRHPTRSPELYWNEALRRDPGDARCNLALGRRRLDEGRFAEAEAHLRRAVARLTARHPNPVTGEAHYHLGLCLEFLDREQESRAAYCKAAWNFEWRAASHYRIACLDARGGDFESALLHAGKALETNADLSHARVLGAILLRRLGLPGGRERLRAVLDMDPLDHAAGAESARISGNRETFLRDTRNDAQTLLDCAFDLAEAGLRDEAVELLEWHLASAPSKSATPNPLARSPMVLYLLAWLQRDMRLLEQARAQSPDHFFPSRLREQQVLEWALAQPGRDPVAAYALGNLCYDRRRHEEAICRWERSSREAPSHAQSHRNLGIALWNVRRNGEGARRCYLDALRCDPLDPRLVSEYDQLCAKLNDDPKERLAFLETKMELVLERDDCCVSLACLLNLAGRPGDALALLRGRRFHPWEGGEGAVLRQYTTAMLLIGQELLERGDATGALRHFEDALNTPQNLGEAYHLHQAQADVNYWKGRAFLELGEEAEARLAFEACAGEQGDFSEMSVTAHSPLSHWRGLALRALGRESEARALFLELKAFGEARLLEPARIDYFATSLPNLLVFDEDLQARREAEARLLIALAHLGLGNHEAAGREMDRVRSFSRALPEAVLFRWPPESVPAC